MGCLVGGVGSLGYVDVYPKMNYLKKMATGLGKSWTIGPWGLGIVCVCVCACTHNEAAAPRLTCLYGSWGE